MPNLLDQLRARLNEIAFYDDVCAALIQNSQLLEEDGLPAIINKKGFEFPDDLCADAQYLSFTFQVPYYSANRDVEDDLGVLVCGK